MKLVSLPYLVLAAGLLFALNAIAGEVRYPEMRTDCLITYEENENIFVYSKCPYEVVVWHWTPDSKHDCAPGATLCLKIVEPGNSAQIAHGGAQYKWAACEHPKGYASLDLKWNEDFTDAKCVARFE